MIYLEDRNNIIVCGGNTKSSEVYSIELDIWQSLSAMNLERNDATLVYINRKYIYCLGGKSKQNYYFNSCEFLDLDNDPNGWRLIDFSNTNLNKINTCFSAVVYHDGKILIVGGSYEDGRYHSSSFFNLVNNDPNRIRIEDAEAFDEYALFSQNDFLENINTDLKSKVYFFLPQEMKINGEL
jgi:hypothetical protein